jgi:N-acetylmuramoyl-L-alanine amidase
VVLAAGAVLLVAAAEGIRLARESSALPTQTTAPPERTGTAAAPAAQPPAPAVVALDPSAFAAGSCEAFLPTSGKRDITVFLDAGHGGVDPGGLGTTSSGRPIDEATETLPIELDAIAILRSEGFRVAVSRTTRGSVARLGPQDLSDGLLTVQGVHDDVAARAVCANDAHADILIGIYLDSAASPQSAGSITGYDAVRPFAVKNLHLAELVQADVLSAMDARGWAIPDQGVIPDSELGSAVSSRAITYGHLMLLGPALPGWFDTPSQMPGALTEPLFVTDPFEATIAASTAGQQVIAQGIARAVNQYFAPPPAAPPTRATAPQVGKQ